MRGATTASGFPAPTCRFHSARRTRAASVTPIDPPEWAAETVAGWYPAGRQTTPHYGTALHAGRTGAADAEQQLDRLILDQSQPAIARASALPLLGPYITPASEPAIKAAIADASPLVRAAAPRALPSSAPRSAALALAPLLSDPVRGVRIEAARALAGTDLLALTPQQQNALVKATTELVAAELVDAERPEPISTSGC